jgi:pimeloyl-ACP methyl ester carboxylesterase
VTIVRDEAALDLCDEGPFFFPAGGEKLFGVVTRPEGDEHSGPAVIVLGGGGTTPTATGRNRFYVTLCRRLARLGHVALRFDYHGLGDSTGSSEFRLDRPFIDDVEGAVSSLADSGVDRYVLVGMCFGARTALSAAPGLPDVAGLVLLAPPVRDFALSEPKTAGWRIRDYAIAAFRPSSLLGTGERLTLRRYLRFAASGIRIVVRRAKDLVPGGGAGPSWVSRRFLGPLTTVTERGIPVLLLYGTDDEEYRDFRSALDAGLGTILEGMPTVEVATLDGQVHGFTRVASQEPTMDAVIDWITRTTRVEAGG